MKVARITISTIEAQAVTMMQAICEDRGQCKFLGNERGEGNEITFLVGMDRPSDAKIIFDARVLANDLPGVGVPFTLQSIEVVSTESCCLPYAALLG